MLFRINIPIIFYAVRALQYKGWVLEWKTSEWIRCLKFFIIKMPIETLNQIKSQILQMSIIQSGLRSVVIYFITWIWSVTLLLTMTGVSKLNQAHYILSSSHSILWCLDDKSWIFLILSQMDVEMSGVWFSAFKDEFKKVDLYSFGRSPIM